MFSGKTEELIRLLRRSEIAGKKILVLKPKIDTRTDNEIASRHQPDLSVLEFHRLHTYPAHPVSNAEEAWKLVRAHQPNVIGIDEAHFFEAWIYDFVSDLLHKSSDSELSVFVAGLDLDAWRKPFGMMPQLMAIADEVQKETAICFVCKKRPGIFTQKLSESERQVEVGDFEIYEARCRLCHSLPGAGNTNKRLEF